MGQTISVCATRERTDNCSERVTPRLGDERKERTPAERQELEALDSRLRSVLDAFETMQVENQKLHNANTSLQREVTSLRNAIGEHSIEKTWHVFDVVEQHYRQLAHHEAKMNSLRDSEMASTAAETCEGELPRWNVNGMATPPLYASGPVGVDFTFRDAPSWDIGLASSTGTPSQSAIIIDDAPAIDLMTAPLASQGGEAPPRQGAMVHSLSSNALQALSSELEQLEAMDWSRCAQLPQCSARALPMTRPHEVGFPGGRPNEVGFPGGEVGFPGGCPQQVGFPGGRPHEVGFPGGRPH